MSDVQTNTAQQHTGNEVFRVKGSTSDEVNKDTGDLRSTKMDKDRDGESDSLSSLSDFNLDGIDINGNDESKLEALLAPYKQNEEIAALLKPQPRYNHDAGISRHNGEVD